MAAVDPTHVDALVKLGLSKYEAKVYLAVVSLGTSVAGRVYKLSGVPRPRVYEVLESLSQKGLVEIQQGRPMRYTARSPTDAIRRLVQSYRATGMELVRHLRKIQATESQRMSQAQAWSIRGERQILNKLRDLISSATKDVSCYRVPEKFVGLLDALVKAKSRGVRLRSLVFEDDPTIWKLSEIFEFRNPLKRMASAKGEYSQAILEILRDVFMPGSEGGRAILQMTIIDDSQSVIVEGWDSALWIQLPVITRTQKLVFDSLWKVSQPIAMEKALQAPAR